MSAHADATVGEVLTEAAGASLCVGSAKVADDPAALVEDIGLRPLAVTDPPLLIAFPLLMLQSEAYAEAAKAH